MLSNWFLQLSKHQGDSGRNFYILNYKLYGFLKRHSLVKNQLRFQLSSQEIPYYQSQTNIPLPFKKHSG